MLKHFYELVKYFPKESQLNSNYKPLTCCPLGKKMTRGSIGFAAPFI